MKDEEKFWVINKLTRNFIDGQGFRWGVHWDFGKEHMKKVALNRGKLQKKINKQNKTKNKEILKKSISSADGFHSDVIKL